MNRKSKWIEIASPDEPMTAVARRALQSRLELVWHHLKRAGESADEAADTSRDDRAEPIHQLRVATRRATAALEIFADLAPPRRGKWYARQLKRVRRAAGDARDLDVLSGRIEHDEALSAESRERLLTFLAGQRRDLRQPVRDAQRRLANRDFNGRIEKFTAKLRPRGLAANSPEPTIHAAGQANLFPLIDAFFAVSSAGFPDDAALHQFRIQGKRLRYALEVFAGAFSPRLRQDAYPRLEQLQEKLGKINDHVTAEQCFQDWLDDGPHADCADLLRQMIGREAVAKEQERSEFLAWWTAERAQELENLLRATLCAPPQVGDLAPVAPLGIAN